ncbi:hypothetical protein AMECASPLE_020946 [Ameca splendens]|uniref:Uncharacterized protein n=1 Tax=Ameca splendens TaxID=208324 RepID=A0ABV0ZQ19_9TELE
MGGSVMEWAEGGVRRCGAKDWGAKCSPREPAPRLTPKGTPVRRVPTRDGGIGTSIGPRHPITRPKEPLPPKKEASRKCAQHRPRVQPNHRKKSRPAGPAQPQYATHRRAHNQHAQPPPNHGAEPTEDPVPNTQHQTPATTRQAGQQNTSHTNTEATNKKHPTQNGKLRTSIGTCTSHRQSSRDPPGQPGSQADPAMHHSAHHHAQGKDTSVTSRGAAKKGHSMHSKEAALPPRNAEPPTSMQAKQK